MHNPIKSLKGKSIFAYSRISLLLILLLTTICGPLFPALFNSIRVDKFKWHVVSTAHFDIYYYDKSEPLLSEIMALLEDVYERVGKIYDYYPEERTPFFIYSNHNEFEQTNIAAIGEGTGGVTEAFKNRFTIFNDGSKIWLDQVITHEFTHVIQFNILYGGFWKSARLLKSFFYPLWIMEGTAEYSTGDLDRTIREMYLRDAATSNGLISVMHLNNFSHLKPHRITLAYKQGESIIRFIEEEYGREKIKLIMETIKTKFESNSFLQDLLKQDAFSFNKRYKEYMKEKYAHYMEELREPSFYGRALTGKEELPVFNTKPVFFPEGDRIAFISDHDGYNAIYTLDISGKEPVYLIGDEFDRVERIYNAGHALDITPDGKKIIFAGEYKQKSYLFVYDIERKKLKKIKFKLDEVKSPAVSPDGKSIVFMGMKNSVMDIYISSLKGGNLKQITDDRNYDEHPIFTGDGKSVIYSSERLKEGDENPYQKDLFMINIKDLSVTQITAMEQDETSPELSPDGNTLYFINDQDFVLDIYKLDLSRGNVHRLTNVIGGNFSVAVSPDGERLLFTSYRGGDTHLYLGKVKDLKGETELSQAAIKTGMDKDLSDEEKRRHALYFDKRGPKYGFKASTDLLFPIMFYSSLDGFFASVFYQASEYLGNHQVQSMVNYGSSDDILDYSVVYSFLRFRPNLVVGASGENYYRDIEQQDRKLEHVQFVGVEYPINRVNSIMFQGTTLYRKERYRDLDNFSVKSRENAVAATFARDTTTGRYLFLDSGGRISLTYEYSDKENLNSDYQYRNHILELVRLIPVGDRSVLAARVLGGVSYGENRGVFRLGGVDRVKGYARNSDSTRFSRVVVGNLRWEFPLVRDMNYYMWYFFPDFFFKGLYFSAFTDAGYGWEKHDELDGVKASDLSHSVGFGFHFYTFVLQTFQLNLNMDWVKRTDSKSSIFYFTLGPVF